ncbi:type IV secretory pathway, VirB2 component (pilin) [Shewanella psychrophila]|uniref:Type IV secretory pathway, VirB2 component (Pilin) n=1 Tax=Shewanella psychrophila TaxID=225848 RepID=A0A1S6HW30_9GAMM|nr:TrbC/VirB2 family protein [Shewanella psychrophila]AQS39765.1 type IV secretory pathway, VirB2 component (pilin) [Shewanella psychrophila]
MLNHSPPPYRSLSITRPTLRLFQLLTEHPLALLGVLLLLSLLMPELAHASSSSSGVPWEDPLSKFVASITGPVAFGISVLAIVAAGVTLIFGGEISGFIKTVIYIALVVALIVGATNVLSSLFGVSSTLVR